MCKEELSNFKLTLSLQNKALLKDILKRAVFNRFPIDRLYDIVRTEKIYNSPKFCLWKNTDIEVDLTKYITIRDILIKLNKITDK